MYYFGQLPQHTTAQSPPATPQSAYTSPSSSRLARSELFPTPALQSNTARWLASTRSPDINRTRHNNHPPTPPAYRASSSYGSAPLPPIVGSFSHAQVSALGSPFATPTSHPTFDIPTETRTIDRGKELEANFAAGLFDGAFHDLPRIPVWPRGDIATDEQLLIICRCLKRVGLTLGGFLAALVSDEPSKHREVSASVSFWLHGQATLPSHQPVGFVKALFAHSSTRTTDGHVEPLCFYPPRYALRPSLRLAPLYKPVYLTQRNAIFNWTVRYIMKHVEKEADSLLAPGSAFVRPRSIEALNWEILKNWDMTTVQDGVASKAPVLFSILAAVATNKTTRRQLKSAAASKVSLATSEASDSDSDAQMDTSEDLEHPDDDLEHPDDPPCDSDSNDVPEKKEPKRKPSCAPGVPEGMLRDAWMGVTIAVLILLRFRSKYSIIFALLLSVYCFSCQTPRDVLSLLCHFGITVSYSTTLRTLTVLAENKLARLRQLIAAGGDGPILGILIFDNVNKLQRAWQPTTVHRNEMQNGTASTFIEFPPSVNPDGLRAEKLLENIKNDARTKLTGQDLLNDLDGAHLEGIGIAIILRTWKQYIPSLSRFNNEIEELFEKRHAKHRLQLRKSQIHPLQPTNIDESLTSGVVEVVRNMLFEQLAVVKSWFAGKWLVLVGGDLLSVDRMRKVKMYMLKGKSALERHEWLVPVVQLWHLRWAWQKAIFRLHWIDDTGKGIFGLHSDCNKIHRSNFNPKTCDFYPADAILKVTFAANLLEILRQVCSHSGGFCPDDVPMTEAVEKYFASEGPCADITFDTLYGWARLAYRRYMVPSAFEDTLDSGARDQQGTYHDSPSSAATEEEATGSAKKTETRSKGTKQSAKYEDKLEDADKVLANNSNFLRMVLWYLELCYAAAEGDVGRIFEIIKFLRFSFWGAGCNNYGNELLELACNFLAEFPEDLKKIIFETYLVNPSGRRGHWFELDLLQEHFNFWLKRLFNTKTTSFEAHHLSVNVGLNIKGFDEIRDTVTRAMGIKRSSYAHTDPNMLNDINALGLEYHTNKTLTYVKGRAHSVLIVDEFNKGIDIVCHQGKFAEYVARTSIRSGTGELPTMETEMGPHETALPAVPDVFTPEGGLETTEFIVIEDEHTN
ncbi:hypothetical protein EV121DRAFT_217780 [Schizophyllum commune]